MQQERALTTTNKCVQHSQALTTSSPSCPWCGLVLEKEAGKITEKRPREAHLCALAVNPYFGTWFSEQEPRNLLPRTIPPEYRRSQDRRPPDVAVSQIVYRQMAAYRGLYRLVGRVLESSHGLSFPLCYRNGVDGVD